MNIDGCMPWKLGTEKGLGADWPSYYGIYPKLYGSI